jgi:hypothetical protein
MNRIRRPFWLPASNYYVLAVAIALAFFFVVWGVLDDIDGLRAPWQTAGVGASILLVGAVVLREMILRRTQAYIRQPSPPRTNDRNKLTIERASAIMAEISRKSDAANVLDRMASGHREVYEMCAAFVQRIDSELATVQAGSPRLAALLRSRIKVSELHRAHMLRWTEVEAQTLSNDARTSPGASDRLRAAREALGTVEKALDAYPAEQALLESRALLNELVVSVQVANAVEAAEQAMNSGDSPTAVRFYQEALEQLEGGAHQPPERERAAHRIRQAIDRLSFPADSR